MNEVIETSVALNSVQEALEAIVVDETSRVGTVSSGDVIRQGDVYLVCVTKKYKKLDRNLKETDNPQLAPGTTQGSRHILTGEFKIYENRRNMGIEDINELIPSTKSWLIPERDRELVGPIFKTLRDVELTHPEHGNKLLPDDEWFAVIYQRALATETRRQLD